MADSRAFTKEILPFGSDETDYVHQSSPHWVLSFVRWENRDTLRVKNVSSKEVRDPLVVENDCIQVSTTSNKGTLTPSMNATLVMTDVNYETAVAPGDFVIVNMLNWPVDARRVADNARDKKPINGVNDGFKGIYKVQSVRKILSVDPMSGTKILLFKIVGYGFTEFNNTIYFNPYMLDMAQDQKNSLLFSSYLGKNWAHLVNKKGLTAVQDMVAVLTQSFIGDGISKSGRLNKQGLVINPNVHFYMPQTVGDLLNIRGVKAAKDIYIFLFGIQKYAAGSSTNLSAGMNPEGLYQKFNRFYYTKHKCAGDSFLKPEYWNQVKAWAIINQYINQPLNEIYTCYRVSPDGDVLPTVVLRQIPFTTEDYKSGGNVTKFLNLPRWKIDPSLILDLDLGRDEAARINFVQYFGKSTVSSSGAEISLEIAKGNYVYDVDDVQRSGLRPYIVTTQFDEPTTSNKEYRSPQWAKIIGDALIGGHMRMNGTITCAGIVDPIAVGDNLEFDGVVYHIEQVSHISTISVQDGKKSFRTSLSLSQGVSLTSSDKGTRYAEMDFTKADLLREDDWTNNENNAILPGVSESQATVYRKKDPDVDDPGHSSANKPYVQPSTRSGGKVKKKGKK